MTIQRCQLDNSSPRTQDFKNLLLALVPIEVTRQKDHERLRIWIRQVGCQFLTLIFPQLHYILHKNQLAGGKQGQTLGRVEKLFDRTFVRT